jgi:hypothetical protein
MGYSGGVRQETKNEEREKPMEQTVQEHNDDLRKAFRKLSISRRNKLESDAKGFIFRNPGSADHSGFWRGLSARQVIETNHGK